MTIPVALTIAGSDSGGGAGIQADLKTFQAFGVFGTTAITAVTAQNTTGVESIHLIPPSMVRAQIRAVAQDLEPRAIKTGMLGTVEIIRAVADAIAEYGLPNYVLDPVMVATSGDRLLDDGAERSLVDALFPLATLITPNLDEASRLVGFAVVDVMAMERAARFLAERGARAVLIKGGHLPGQDVVDIFFDGSTIRRYQRVRILTKPTHGSGCTLSAAITAQLALGSDLIRAIESGLDFVHRAIASALNPGRGSAPLNHFVQPHRRPSE